jgi:hypothetical protein
MSPIQFIETLISLGYNFFVLPEDSKVVIELSLEASSYKDGDEITPPSGLPKLPYKAIARREEEYDELFYIVFVWSFELAECPAEPPRQ